MSAFSALSIEALRALATAYESGRLVDGSPLALAAHLPSTDAREVGDEIDRLFKSGMRLTHVSYLLRTLVADRERSGSQGPSVDLVWTGPEGNESWSRDTGVVIRELFVSARESVLVVGFAIHRGREIFQLLSERMEEIPTLKVQMFLNVARALRDTTRSDQLLLRFASDFKRQHWPGKRLPEIYYDPRSLAIDEATRTSLHAKCVVVDGARSLVTSANFTEAAQRRNIEVGVLVHDEPFARSLIDQFQGLVCTGAAARLAVA